MDITSSFEQMIEERDHHDRCMGMILEGKLHLCKGKVEYPLSDEQKQKDKFLFKYHEYNYYRLDELITNSFKEK